MRCDKKVSREEAKSLVRNYMGLGLNREICLDVVGLTRNQFYYSTKGTKPDKGVQIIRWCCSFKEVVIRDLLIYSARIIVDFAHDFRCDYDFIVNLPPPVIVINPLPRFWNALLA